MGNGVSRRFVGKLCCWCAWDLVSRFSANLLKWLNIGKFSLALLERHCFVKTKVFVTNATFSIKIPYFNTLLLFILLHVFCFVKLGVVPIVTYTFDAIHVLLKYGRLVEMVSCFILLVVVSIIIDLK